MSQPSSIFFGRYLTKRHFITVGIASLAMVLIFGAVLLLPSRATEQRVQPTRTIPVAVLAAKKLDSYEIARRYTGQIKAARHSALAFQRGGEVIELLVDIGDRVSKGQALAKLDQRHLLAEQTARHAELQQAKAVYAELVAGPRAETIAAAEADVRDLDAQLKNASNDVKRRESLVNTTAVTFEEYEEALFEMQALTARREVAAQKLSELRNGTRKERIDAQRGKVLQAEARLADLQHDLEDTILRAPYEGRLSARHLDEGAVVSAGTVAFEITEVSELEFWVGLPPEVAKGIEEERTYVINIDGVLSEAILKSKSPTVSRQTHTRTLLFRVIGTSADLVDGQVGRIELPQTIQKTGFWIPTTALVQQSRGLWSAYIAEERDGSYLAASRFVEVLATEGDRSIVRGTFTEGDSVIVEGVHRIVEGQLVDPVLNTHEEQASSELSAEKVLP